MRLFWRPSVYLSFFAAGVVALGVWLLPRPLTDEQLLPPAGLPASLRANGVFSGDWSFLSGVASPVDVMVRRSRGISQEMLASAIRASTREVMREGSRPVPHKMIDHLTRHYGHTIVERVRWTVRGQRAELGSLLTAWVLEEGAVTLDHVIVFDNADLADNLWLWAHELAHVEQYRRLGIDGFAAAYLADWQGMEAEATARADKVVAAIREEEANAPVLWLAGDE
ncbi:eCIS core domain-containing protein [Polymorphobacter sp.]|uniref:eCIS core domain-containing protein n=1 Tax=Polymorphobacter sp. TaxID=1909290 RepID=UPI003F712B97